MMNYLIFFALLSLALPSFAQGPGIERQPFSIQEDSKFTHMPDRLVRLKERVMGDKVNRDHTLNLRSIMVLQPIQLYDSIYTWEWDALNALWVVEYRYVDIAYDNHHQLASAMGQEWNGIFWENDELIAFEYDSAGNEIGLISKSWDGGTWQNGIMIRREFNHKNLVIEETLLLGDSQKWKNLNRYVFEYDPEGNRVLEVNLEWSIAHWQNEFQNLYVYEEKKLTKKTAQYWQGDSWINQYSNRMTYDGKDSLILLVNQIWIEDEWDYTSQISYVYDTVFNTTIETEQNWNGVEWENRYQDIYTYNADKKLDTKVIFQWFNGSWNETDLVVYEYDGNLNLVETTYYDRSENGWLRYRQFLTIFDEHDFISGTIQKGFGQDGVTITFGDSTVIYYKTITALKDKLTEYQPVSIYPNPSDGSFTIAGDQIKCVNVFNSLGQFVYTIQQDEPQAVLPIVLPGLVPGIYLVQVSDQGKIITHQVVIR